MKEVFFMEAREPVCKYFKPAWKSFYMMFFLMILLIAAAVCAGIFIPSVKENPALSKWMWIAVAVIEVILFLTIAVKRAMMCLILRDDPQKPENQEIAYIVSHPLKPFSPDFRESIEIGLVNITDIRVRQTMMQTILNVGDVIITSSGTGKEEIQARNIPNPTEVRDEIQEHMGYYQHS